MLKTPGAGLGRFLSALLLCCPLLVAGIAGAQPVSAPDVIPIGSKSWPERKFGDAVFSHKKHVQDYKISCTDCHHSFKDGKNVWKEGQEVQRCEACHTCVKTGKALMDAPPEEKKMSLFNAYHTNCKGCHAKYNQEHGTQAAPIKCTDCHPKK